MEKRKRKYLRKVDMELLYKARYGSELVDITRKVGYTIADYAEANEVYDLITGGNYESSEEFKAILRRCKIRHERELLEGYNRFI